MLQEEAKKREALKISIKEGTAANLSASFGDQYITPVVLAMQGSTVHIGVLNALAGIAGPIAQLWGNRLQKRYSNKKIVTVNALIQAVLWFAIALISLFAMTHQSSFPRIGIIVLYTTIIIAGGVLHPAFFSWMGLLVKKDERGKYFSRRSAIIGTIGLIAVVISARILDIFKSNESALLGFALLFALAASSRAVSYYYFTRQYEPKSKSKVIEMNLAKFLSLESRIGKFTIGMAAFNFALMIASPFFAVYLLDEKGYSYILFTVVIMSGTAWNLLFLPLVGKFSDRYGNASLLKLAGIMFTITPPMWIFLQHPLTIILLPQLLNGIANASFNIGFSNYLYANVSQEKRGTAVAHINILGGIGTVVGSLVGGFLLSEFRSFAGIFLIVFLAATLCRGAVSAFFLSKLRDVRSTHGKNIQFDIIHPVRTIQHDTHLMKNLLEK